MKLIDYKEGCYNSQADPFLIESTDGKFYLYTGGADGVHAFCSSSLIGEYKDIGVVFSMEGKQEYWAPSVIYTKGKYYMYVSCVAVGEDDPHQQAMHVAECNNAFGPFINGQKLIEPFSIDSHVVENETGLYIFYSTNDYDSVRAGTYIVVDKMESPTKVCSHPVAVVKPSLDEEIFQKDRFKKGQHWHTIEGAFYFNDGDHHYLIYSGNCYQNEFYFLGYAVAKSKERDLTKIKFNKYPSDSVYSPLICKNEWEAGTGHNSVIKYKGEWYCIYHGRDIPADPRLVGAVDDRTARICKLIVKDGTLVADRKKDSL